ncbi:hypothetical protein GCM10023116_02280 [Kistimonas scapharcae]|uniref:Type II secretion system protein M n=1 Tax=Kistimonas scapharcae TaxID=1036133 RepID=A0ABP8UVP0_9GAMM
MGKLVDALAPYLDRARDYYAQLSSRDQRALLVLSIFFAVMLVYFAVWHPIASWSAKQRADYVYEKETHALMVANQGKARSVVTASSQSAPTKDAASVIASSGKRSGLTLTRVQPARQGVSVWIDEVPYQKLLGWLIYLNEKEHLQIRQIRIDRTEQDGVVKVFMRLSY